jgi:hypothetical protein
MTSLIFFIASTLSYADAICADGHLSSSSGRGTCSHHGGVKTWVYPPTPIVPVYTRPVTPSLPSSPLTPITEDDLLPLLHNKEATEAWRSGSARPIIKIMAHDPNDTSTSGSLLAAVTPIWICSDGVGSDKQTFSCWSSNSADCVPEWHSFLEMTCPVQCKPYQER